MYEAPLFDTRQMAPFKHGAEEQAFESLFSHTNIVIQIKLFKFFAAYIIIITYLTVSSRIKLWTNTSISSACRLTCCSVITRSTVAGIKL